MTLQENINKIKPYFKSLQTYNDGLIVSVMFPRKWLKFNSEDERVRFAHSEEVEGEILYYGNGNEVDLDDIFKLIQDTIEVNQSLEIKAQLLRDKVSELTELFESTPLAKLQNLKFVISDDKTKTTTPKAKRKYTRKKKDNTEKTEVNESSGQTVSNKTESAGEDVVSINTSVMKEYKKIKKGITV